MCCLGLSCCHAALEVSGLLPRDSPGTILVSWPGRLVFSSRCGIIRVVGRSSCSRGQGSGPGPMRMGSLLGFVQVHFPRRDPCRMGISRVLAPDGGIALQVCAARGRGPSAAASR